MTRTTGRGERRAGLPVAWSQVVRTNPVFPGWSRPPLLRLLKTPRWAYLSVASLVLVGGLSVSICLILLYAYLSRPVAIPTPLVGSSTQTGHIYAADGTLLADLHGAINRQSIPLSEMSVPLKQAVLAAEDSGFYSQRALDFKSIIRAGIVDFFAGRYAEGGSTITQQYVKLEYLGPQKTLSRKIQEARLAYQIERRLTKNQIFDRYLNTVYFGRGAYGVQSAALTFFGVPASRLDVSQSALLAGILNSPSAYSPDTNPSAAEARRRYVINRMQALGDIDAKAASQARKNPPSLATPPQPGTIAHADPYFVDTVRAYLFQKYGEAEVLGGGLNVQTTLEPTQQTVAHAAVAKALPTPGDPAAALVSVDPKTGYVTAMVGGSDFATSQFNLATQGRRQPGSAMKPFVLIAALEKGISPLTLYDAPARICLPGWLPTCEVQTYNGEDFGTANLETATIYSVNTVYAQLIMQVGPQSVVAVANAMGIPGPSWLLPAAAGCRPLGSPDCTTHLVAEPSLALGSNDVSPLEMASAYATLADHGVYHKPRFVSKVTDAQGNVLQSGPSERQQVLDPSIVATVDRILHEVVTMGTGTGANIGRPAAGKTGTTSGFTNAWFVGYTPELSTSVWIGYPSADKPLLNIEGVAQMVGGSIPAQLWANYMESALPAASPARLAADAESMGLTNPTQTGVTQTVVATATGTETVTAIGGAASPLAYCQSLPSATVVSPLPSPVTGTLYNVYPYLTCAAAPSRSPTSTVAAPTDTATPASIPSPGGTSSPAPTPTPSPSVAQPGERPSPLFLPPSPAPGCALVLLC